MDMLSILLLVLVGVWIIAAVWYLLRHRGTGCCGTGGGKKSCSGCSGGCSGCGRCRDGK